MNRQEAVRRATELVEQKRYDTDFRRIDKMCRLRMVFSLWGKQAE